MTSLFIFRRDYRLQDNTALINCLKNSKKVLPIFILTPEQLTNNDYKSDSSVQFMFESLEELNDNLKKFNSKIYYFYGKPKLVLKDILKNNKIDSVYVNYDYTPYSISRDRELKQMCKSNNVNFLFYEDHLLNPVKSILNNSGNIYQKFTPYFDKAKKIKVREPKKNGYRNYANSKTRIKSKYTFTGNFNKFYEYNGQVLIGGRTKALKILKGINKFGSYNRCRNMLTYNTTRLSPYIKFGCVSIREVYYNFVSKLGKNNDLIKQLYWRDFYYNVSYSHLYVLENTNKNINRNFKEEYAKIKWIKYEKATKKQKELWDSWTNGITGYPIVDACMRELNETGYMHNRGRLIVSNFLIKILLWSWEDGEKYFAQKLVDYDPSVNNGNWQWGSGSGTDSQPYFRIFNPWTQSKKFDKDAKYIKHWVPELQNVRAVDLHKWSEMHNNYDVNYPRPIVDYKIQRQKALKMFDDGLN